MIWASLVAQLVKNPPAMQETPVLFPGLGWSPGEGIGYSPPVFSGFPGGSDGKESACNVGNLGSIPGLGRCPEGKSYPLLVFWPGEFHGLYSPWGRRVQHDWVTFTFAWTGCGLTHITYSCPFIFTVLPSYSHFFHICRFQATTDHVSTVVFAVEKYPHTSGSTWFKGQLYIQMIHTNTSVFPKG